MKCNKKNIQVGIAVLLTALFFGLLISSLYYYALVDFFLIAIVISLLKKYEVKTVLLLLSPMIVYPLIWVLISLLPFSFWDQIFGWRNSGTAEMIILPTTMGLLYAYLFRDIFTKFIEPSYRWILIGLMGLMLLSSTFVIPVINQCEIISASEKGVTKQEVSGCQMLGLYRGGANRHSFGWDRTLAAYTFIPTIIILLGMSLQYATRKNESA